MNSALVLRAVPGCIALFLACLVSRGETELERGFQAPPASARPQTWWHWMNGNITREGITADLEAMKRAGVGGAQILNVSCSIPHGPVQVLGPEWRQLMRHAFAEGDRLGLEICVHNCPGYTSSGGPCVPPEQAMQMVTVSELHVSGPARLALTLPEPEKRNGFYRDIAVLAFPILPGDAQKMADLKPAFSSSAGALDGAMLLDGNPETQVNLPLPEPGKPQFLQLEFSQPFEARSLTVWLPAGLHTHTAELQVSEDGKSFRKVREVTLQNQGWSPSWQTDSFEAAKGRWFRLVITKSRTKAGTVGLGEVSLGQRLQTDRMSVKAGYDRADGLDPEGGCIAPAGMAIARKQLVDLTARLQPDGKLNWAVPAGAWTILRLGHTCTGKRNHPAPPEAAGLEVDKLNCEALDAFWSGMMKPLIEEAGPLAGRSFNNVLIDSYEVGGQNWTTRMREEFHKRRGYDLQPFLPALTGRVVENPELTERFLWDFRRTLADLFAENYFGRMAQLCHRHGLMFSAETYGNAVFDELHCGAKADIAMGEFWSTGGGMLETLKLAASSAHTRGRALVGAEAFTSSEKADEWRLEPWSLKAVGDLAFCEGVNRYIFHRWAHQPWLDKFPGMTMGPYGLHFERTQTWWEPGAAWLRYIARCQFLLQQGQFVGDLCYFIGEGQPAKLPARATLQPAVPAGYDYDGCDLEMLRQMQVKGSRLVLPGGMSYRVLVLPESQFMTPATLAKVRELVKAGATVVGPKPVKSPSLAGFPKCDAQVAKLAEEVWANCDGKTAQEHAFGKGRVVWGKPLDHVLAESGTAPDFQEVMEIRYIHRRAGSADLYFVSNQRRATGKEFEASFRVSGKQPELWHPDSGVIEPAAVWSEQGGRTRVPLRLDAAGSVFVVFRKPAGQNEHAAGMARLTGSPAGQAAPNIIIRKAIYEGIEGGGSKDVTRKLTELVQAGKLSISAENTLFGDPAPMQHKRLRVEYSLNGKPLRKVVDEKQVLQLDTVGEVPEARLVVKANKAELQTFRSGTYEVKTDRGGWVVVEVGTMPGPVEINGPWTVRFPPNWGAPKEAAFDQLISWTEHAEPGIRYFSGTAEYVKEFDMPAALLEGSRQLWLDLGGVKNFAAVTLNGKEFEALWKPPFRLEVSSAVKPGRNTLVIKVTNLWPNRLIGDEQLPDDREWEGTRLKQWPEWLLKGEPRPKTGRVTFTTWHHHDKDSRLLESGLLGPVFLRAAEVRAVPGL